MRVIIVGGVAGGASAAARIRRLDERAQITIYERTGFVSYANCGLPYFVGGVITDRNELSLQTPESFWQRFRVDVRVRHEVIEIRPEQKTVVVRNLMTGETLEDRYDKLLLSPGAKPTRPNMSGIENGKIFTLRTVEDTLKIHRFVREQRSKSAAVIGGSFIGVEMAENLSQLGMKVTVIEYSDHLMAPLDFDMACAVHAQMRRRGIELNQYVRYGI